MIKKYFFGYSSHNKAYKIYNLRTQIVMESINMVVDDNLKESVKKYRDNIIDITDTIMREKAFLMDKIQSS